MAKYNKVIGVFFFILFVYQTIGVYERFKIYEYGKFVEVKIINKQIGGGSLSSHWIDFLYAGKEYSKNVGIAYYNEINIGDKMKMKYLDGEKYFLMSTENPRVRFYLNFILLGISVFFLFFNKKKEKS